MLRQYLVTVELQLWTTSVSCFTWQCLWAWISWYMIKVCLQLCLQRIYSLIVLLIIFFHIGFIYRFGDSVDNTVKNSIQYLLPALNALIVVSKGMWAVTLCTNKILQRRLTCVIGVNRWLVDSCICSVRSATYDWYERTTTTTTV